jgi:hypothetical protein
MKANLPWKELRIVLLFLSVYISLFYIIVVPIKSYYIGVSPLGFARIRGTNIRGKMVHLTFWPLILIDQRVRPENWWFRTQNDGVGPKRWGQ